MVQSSEQCVPSGQSSLFTLDILELTNSISWKDSVLNWPYVLNKQVSSSHPELDAYRGALWYNDEAFADPRSELSNTANGTHNQIFISREYLPYSFCNKGGWSLKLRPQNNEQPTHLLFSRTDPGFTLCRGPTAKRPTTQRLEVIVVVPLKETKESVFQNDENRWRLLNQPMQMTHHINSLVVEVWHAFETTDGRPVWKQHFDDHPTYSPLWDTFKNYLFMKEEEKHTETS